MQRDAAGLFSTFCVHDSPVKLVFFWDAHAARLHVLATFALAGHLSSAVCSTLVCNWGSPKNGIQKCDVRFFATFMASIASP